MLLAKRVSMQLIEGQLHPHPITRTACPSSHVQSKLRVSAKSVSRGRWESRSRITDCSLLLDGKHGAAPISLETAALDIFDLVPRLCISIQWDLN